MIFDGGVEAATCFVSPTHPSLNLLFIGAVLGNFVKLFRFRKEYKDFYSF